MIAWFVRHPVASNLLMALICILGLSTVSNIERETFPDTTASTVLVSISYPGASAVDVDEDICTRLEDAISGTDGLAELDCLSVDGRAVATAELETGGDNIQFYNDVSSAVSGVNDFPADAETPSIERGGRTEMIARIAVSGIDGKKGLLEYTDDLANRLQGVDGVSEAIVSGLADRELRVTFDDEELRRYGLSSQGVVDAINARSLQQPLGEVETTEKSLVLRYSDVRRTVADLEDLIVLQNESGGIVRLKDLATVRIVDSDKNTQSFIDGAQTATIQIMKATDGDSIRIFERVEAILEEERATWAEPFQITVTNNLTEIVEERLSLIVTNIVMGLVLVFAVMWMFFTLKEALWISAALPVSFLGGLFLMNALGVTINMITLIALLMAVGLIMDDSIVIAENIDKWRSRVGGKEAAWRGTQEILPGVLSSFLTTACVFGPLMFIDGDLGEVLKYIPMVLLLTLGLSLLEGFLILPHHLSQIGKGTPAAHKERPAARVLERFKEGVVIPAAGALARVRYLTIGTVLGALVLSIGLVASGQIKVVGFPQVEGDTIEAKIALTSGIARKRTVANVEQILAALERVDARYTPGTEGAAPLVERVLVSYGTNSNVNDNGSNTATVTVDLLEAEKRNVSASEVLRVWRAESGALPDLHQVSFAQNEMGPGGNDIDIDISGRDLGDVEAAASEVLARLLERIDVKEAYSDFYGGRQEVKLTLNEYGYSVGLTPQSLSAQLRQAFQGSETDTFHTGASNVNVQVQLGDTVANLTELEEFPIIVGDGKQAALITVADMDLAASYPTITRKDGRVVANILGQIDRKATTSTAISTFVLDEVAPELERLYPGTTVSIGGATEEQKKSQSSVGSKLLLGLIGVYMVLAFQFRSYTLPIVVMLSIPFALIGTILGHWAMGLDLSMPSMIGFASLAGIVVNNAILFLTFFQTHLRGDDHVAAALDAVRARFRPILLSTGTTVAGLLPLIANSSVHVQTMVPLVVSVAAGLTASMILVTLVLPSLLSIYFDIFPVQKWVEKFDDGESGDIPAQKGPLVET
ncbi:efflux RND transporter permease subunit [Aliiruegeria sabulilitoris]|uniref:efflux RND transporter permease subunit n=1 Tax=Aliiruegeria sabulilitoris TaxID=1510458 RepID=UPI0008374CE6|nr:efflux RND transporter permease subunit [Aliiruegeria sabulilitoris]NDR58721.1 efflux RND transporter permease subunit [Pseudoruegeria sp. M32A2M]